MPLMVRGIGGRVGGQGFVLCLLQVPVNLKTCFPVISPPSLKKKLVNIPVLGILG